MRLWDVIITVIPDRVFNVPTLNVPILRRTYLALLKALLSSDVIADRPNCEELMSRLANELGVQYSKRGDRHANYSIQLSDNDLNVEITTFSGVSGECPGINIRLLKDRRAYHIPNFYIPNAINRLISAGLLKTGSKPGTYVTTVSRDEVLRDIDEFEKYMSDKAAIINTCHYEEGESVYLNTEYFFIRSGDSLIRIDRVSDTVFNDGNRRIHIVRRDQLNDLLLEVNISCRAYTVYDESMVFKELNKIVGYGLIGLDRDIQIEALNLAKKNAKRMKWDCDMGAQWYDPEYLWNPFIDVKMSSVNIEELSRYKVNPVDRVQIPYSLLKKFKDGWIMSQQITNFTTALSIVNNKLSNLFMVIDEEIPISKICLQGREIRGG